MKKTTKGLIMVFSGIAFYSIGMLSTFILGDKNFIYIFSGICGVVLSLFGNSYLILHGDS